MAYKSDKTRCNLTGDAISRERLRVVRVNATVARRHVGRVPLWRSLAQLSAVPEISQRVTTRVRATERTIGRRPAWTSTTVLRAERLDLSGSMHGTQGAHPGRGGGWAAGLSEYGGNMCKNVEFCTN
eukprot:985947-Prymnesium_polylepis.1